MTFLSFCYDLLIADGVKQTCPNAGIELRNGPPDRTLPSIGNARQTKSAVARSLFDQVFPMHRR